MSSKEILGMYYGEITVVDGATINRDGWLVGQSVNPSAKITGTLLNGEQVIADFSSAKKHIKEIIDDKETGLDHKLWVFSDSNCKALAGKTKDHLNVVSPLVDMQVPNNGVVFMRRPAGDFSDISKVVCKHLSVKVTSELKRRWPDKYQGLGKVEFFDGNHLSIPDFDVSVLDVRPKKTFRYTHGLAKSTSWGCQLIAHGHLSYVSVFDKNRLRLTEWEDKIAFLLDGTYIVSNEHIIDTPDSTETVSIAYNSMSRGSMELKISQKMVASHSIGDLFITQDEPTIENIVQEIAAHYGDEMKAAGVAEFMISEGSNKGAYYSFE